MFDSPLEITVGIAALLCGLFWVILLRPRRGGPQAPPLVTSSPAVPLPSLLGVLAEFFRSPNTMVKRCYQDYGSVFTIPVGFGITFALSVVELVCVFVISRN
jgi:hypothetical protein